MGQAEGSGRVYGEEYLSMVFLIVLEPVGGESESRLGNILLNNLFAPINSYFSMQILTKKI